MTGGAAPAVLLQDVSKSFGEKPILRDVSFEVRAGEALCILGRSGTGKSVTLKLIISLLKPTRGRFGLTVRKSRACTPRSCRACGERWDFSSRVQRFSIR